MRRACPAFFNRLPRVSATGTPNFTFDLQKVFYNSGGVHHNPELSTSIPSFVDIGKTLAPGQSIRFPQRGISGLFAVQPFDTTGPRQESFDVSVLLREASSLRAPVDHWRQGKSSTSLRKRRESSKDAAAALKGAGPLNLDIFGKTSRILQRRRTLFENARFCTVHICRSNRATNESNDLNKSKRSHGCNTDQTQRGLSAAADNERN